MTGARAIDEHLRMRALSLLGALGDPLARESLERGAIAIEHDPLVAWEGTAGRMEGHRIVVLLPRSLLPSVEASHAARDGLNAALAAALAERSGHTVADLRLEGADDGPASSPYRGRV